MASILVPFDGSEAAQRALRAAMELARKLKETPLIELVNVQMPVRKDVSMFVGSRQVEDYHREEGMKALAPGREILDASGLRYEVHIGVGEPAEVIQQFEKRCDCLLICMATRGAGAISRALLGSVAQAVVQLAAAPVVLVK